MHSRTFIASILIFSAGSVAIVGAEDTPSPAKVAKHAFGPAAFARAGLGAGLNQANNTPREWGQGGAGFGKRLGSAFGKHLVKTAIQYPVARIMHEELGYHRSPKQGFGPRLTWALESTVITHKTDSHKRTLATGELAGAFGAGFISRLWQPASVAGVSHAFASGGLTLGVDAGGNVLREFWPEIRHPHRHNQANNPNAAVVNPTSAVSGG